MNCAIKKKITGNITVVLTGLSTVHLKYTAVKFVSELPLTWSLLKQTFLHPPVYLIQLHTLKALLVSNLPVGRQVTVP
jgi:hypothetical protein